MKVKALVYFVDLAHNLLQLLVELGSDSKMVPLDSGLILWRNGVWRKGFQRGSLKNGMGRATQQL